MASKREISFSKYWEGKEHRKITIEVVRDAYLSGWSDNRSSFIEEAINLELLYVLKRFLAWSENANNVWPGEDAKALIKRVDNAS